MKITNTNGNSRNGIRGGRVTIRTDRGTLVDRFEVTVMRMTAQRYCERHPGGEYGLRYRTAIAKAIALETQEGVTGVWHVYVYLLTTGRGSWEGITVTGSDAVQARQVAVQRLCRRYPSRDGYLITVHTPAEYAADHEGRHVTQ